MRGATGTAVAPTSHLPPYTSHLSFEESSGRNGPRILRTWAATNQVRVP